MSETSNNYVIDPSIDEFEHTHLSSIDPNDNTVEEDVYDLEIGKTAKQAFQDKKTGQDKYFYKFDLTIVRHAKRSGRRLFPVMFPDGETLKACRKLMDATGVPQEQDETVGDWIIRVGTIQPKAIFRTQVTRKLDKKKTQQAKEANPDAAEVFANYVNWREVVAAN